MMSVRLSCDYENPETLENCEHDIVAGDPGELDYRARAQGWTVSDGGSDYCANHDPADPDNHHPDCDYRNSTYAHENAVLFGTPEYDTEIFDCTCNLEYVRENADA